MTSCHHCGGDASQDGGGEGSFILLIFVIFILFLGSLALICQPPECCDDNSCTEEVHP